MKTDFVFLSGGKIKVAVGTSFNSMTFDFVDINDYLIKSADDDQC